MLARERREVSTRISLSKDAEYSVDEKRRTALMLDATPITSHLSAIEVDPVPFGLSSET